MNLVSRSLNTEGSTTSIRFGVVSGTRHVRYMLHYLSQGKNTGSGGGGALTLTSQERLLLLAYPTKNILLF